MSACYIDLFGPLYWLSKRQSVTPGSSVEAEIYAADECIKFLLELEQLLTFLEVKHLFMPSTICHVDGKTNLADLFTK